MLYCTIGWLVGWFVGWLVGWLVGCLVSQLVSLLQYGSEQPEIGTSKFTLSHDLGSERASEQTRERSGARERSEQCGANERVSGASERASGQANGPVLTSKLLA